MSATVPFDFTIPQSETLDFAHKLCTLQGETYWVSYHRVCPTKQKTPPSRLEAQVSRWTFLFALGEPYPRLARKRLRSPSQVAGSALANYS